MLYSYWSYNWNRVSAHAKDAKVIDVSGLPVNAWKRRWHREHWSTTQLSVANVPKQIVVSSVGRKLEKTNLLTSLTDRYSYVLTCSLLFLMKILSDKLRSRLQICLEAVSTEIYSRINLCRPCLYSNNCL